MGLGLGTWDGLGIDHNYFIFDFINAMAPSPSTVINILVLPTALPALHMLLIAAGIFEPDDDSHLITQFWSQLFVGNADKFSVRLFHGFVGTGKLIGNVAMWCYLPNWLCLGILLPAICGGFMHAYDVPSGTFAVMTSVAAGMAAMIAYTMAVD